MRDGLYARAALSLLPRRRGTALPTGELLSTGVTVDREHLASYDRVCGFRLSDELPATYPHVLAFPLAMRLMSAADFPFPVVGLVHVGNRITVRRPVDAGLPLDFAVRAAGLRAHPRGQQFDILTTATAGGEEVWSGVSTYLKKGDAATQRPKEPGKKDPAARSVSSAKWRVPARIGPEYAAVSGDHNPIHTSRLGARLFGFPRTIAHGMWSKARCLAALEGRLPPAYTVEVAFKLPILLPATVSFGATATGDGWEFTLDSPRPHLAGAVTHP